MSPSRLAVVFLFVAASGVLSAENVTIRQPALLRADRALVSLKPGTVVELLSRADGKVTIRYENHTGSIPADRLLEAPKPPEEIKPAEPAKGTPPSAQTAPKTDKPVPARPPQSMPGKAIEKAKENVKKHDDARVET